MPGAEPIIIRKQIILAALVITTGLVWAGLTGTTARAAEEVAVAHVNTDASPFPRPAALEPSINFWIKAFTYWSERDFVVHDRDNVSLIYQKFHVPGDGAPTGEEVDVQGATSIGLCARGAEFTRAAGFERAIP